MTSCVVVVPGIMGSVLKLNGQVIWPGSVLNAFITRYDEMNELLDPAAVAAGLIRKVFVFSQYEDLLDDLEHLGFEPGDTLLPCAYDWRKPNEDSAKTLADVLDEAAVRHADAEITLIAHSMGGLVARHYLESGLFKTRPGFAKVKRLITLGTPHFGAPKALGAVLGLERQAFLQPDQVRILASDPRYPSAYQLLPQKGQPFAWNLDPQNLYQPVDIWDPGVAAKLGLVQANLDAALRFQQTLDPGKAPVPYFCFVGTHQSTISHVHLNLKATTVDNQIRRIEPEKSGDGTVPTWSAGVPQVQALWVGGEHGTIFKNRDLRQTLSALLGRPGILAPADPNVVEVALRDHVHAPGALVHGALAFTSRASLQGEIRTERAAADGAQWSPAGAPLPVRYDGISADSIGVVFDAPQFRGAYRVQFFFQGATQPAGEDHLFVQS
jgi:phospholipase A1